MRTTTRARLHQLGSQFGIDLVPYSSMRHAVGRRARVMRSLGIDLVLDVGANSGQFAREIRRHGYRGRIVSFEPLAEPFAVLAREAARDPNWEANQIALADFDGSAQINVAANAGASSSLLQMLPLHMDVAPNATIVGTEEVAVRRLDGIAPGLMSGSRSTYLKVDVQGAEEQVLAGAAASLPAMSAVQLELSLVALYEGARLFDDVVATMKDRGFRLVGLEPGLVDLTNGTLLQVDGLFVRRDQGA